MQKIVFPKSAVLLTSRSGVTFYHVSFKNNKASENEKGSSEKFSACDECVDVSPCYEIYQEAFTNAFAGMRNPHVR